VGWLRIVIVVMGVGVGVVVAPSGSAAVLYRTPNAILASTAASGRLAWIEATHSFKCAHVYRRRALGASRVKVTHCRNLDRNDLPWVRLVGARVYWDERFRFSPPSDTVRTADDLGHMKLLVGSWSVPCASIGCTPSSTGKQLGPIAVGDGALFYTVFDWSFDTSGVGSVVGGKVRRAVTGPRSGVRHFTVAGAPAAALLDQAGKRILEVPAVTPGNTITPSQILQLRHDRSGKLAWSITFAGTARAVALSGEDAITLVKTPTGRMRIRAYDARSGTLIRTLVLAHSRVREIGVAGPRVVFAYPRRVMLWNVRHNLLHQFQHTSQTFPANPTISGRLVTWRQSTPFGSTIHGVVLPPLRP
jgi:hypothetical protein